MNEFPWKDVLISILMLVFFVISLAVIISVGSQILALLKFGMLIWLLTTS